MSIWALVLASLLWGTTGTAAHLLPDDVSPVATGAMTMGLGGMLLLAVSPRGALRVIRDRTDRRLLLVGAVGVAVYPITFYPAMDLAGVAVGNVVALGSGPVFAALYEWTIEGHRPTRRWFWSTGIAVVGIALLAAGGHGGGTAPKAIVPGVLLGLIAGAAYALYAWASARVIASGHAPRGVMAGMFGLGAIPLLPVMLVLGGPLLQSATTVGVSAYLVVGPMFVAYLLFGVGLRRIRSSTATTVTLLEPVVATVLAVSIVGERLAPTGWLGLALVLGGIAWLATARRAPAATPAT